MQLFQPFGRLLIQFPKKKNQQIRHWWNLGAVNWESKHIIPIKFEVGYFSIKELNNSLEVFLGFDFEAII